MRLPLMEQDTHSLVVVEATSVQYNTQEEELYCFTSSGFVYCVGPIGRTEASDIQLALFRDGTVDVTQYNAEFFVIAQEEV